MVFFLFRSVLSSLKCHVFYSHPDLELNQKQQSQISFIKLHSSEYTSPWTQFTTREIRSTPSEICQTENQPNVYSTSAVCSIR